MKPLKAEIQVGHLQNESWEKRQEVVEGRNVR
jgi:hypothetical protein